MSLVSVGCQSAMPRWNLFSKRGEPSAETLAGSGPTVTYPTPPSNAASPQAIASVAGGTQPAAANVPGASPAARVATANTGASFQSTPMAEPSPYSLSGISKTTPTTSGVPSSQTLPQTFGALPGAASNGTPTAGATASIGTPQTPSVANGFAGAATPSGNPYGNVGMPVGYTTNGSAPGTTAPTTSGYTFGGVPSPETQPASLTQGALKADSGTPSFTLPGGVPAMPGFDPPNGSSNSGQPAASAPAPSKGGFALPPMASTSAAASPATSQIGLANPATSSPSSSKPASSKPASSKPASEAPSAGTEVAGGSPGSYTPGSTSGASAYPGVINR
ncbi:MAG: hypothetical protein AAGD07_19220 [Planctomycetota bacterium]